MGDERSGLFHPETTTIDTADEDGNPTTTEITETVLVIELTHKTLDEMAADYHFTTRQNTYLQLLQDPQYEELWAELLGGFAQGGGEVMSPYSTRTPTGTLQWPLPVAAGTITSQFGHRVDPITGEVSSHTGTDIACAEGTPILAAADGIVTIANGLDSRGGSYGYYIQIDHGGGPQTLYAHCSSICVTGQQVPGRAGHWLCWSHRAGDRQPSASGSKNRGQPCGCNAILYTIKFKRIFDGC